MHATVCGTLKLWCHPGSLHLFLPQVVTLHSLFNSSMNTAQQCDSTSESTTHSFNNVIFKEETGSLLPEGCSFALAFTVLHKESLVWLCETTFFLQPPTLGDIKNNCNSDAHQMNECKVKLLSQFLLFSVSVEFLKLKSHFK